MKKLKGLTIHNNAKKGDFAKIVLMPGDPLRAKMIAEKYLENAKLVNDVRGMLAYTGDYKGKKVSVMASGMGMASAGIYSYELFKFYDVDTIIRIGTTGSLDRNLEIGDIVLAEKAVTGSSFAYEMGAGDLKECLPNKKLNGEIIDVSKYKSIKVIEGIVNCSDNFYTITEEAKFIGMTERNAIVSDMESFAIFLNAKILNKKAACLLTVTDPIFESDTSHVPMNAEERQEKLTNMIELALEGALNLL